MEEREARTATFRTHVSEGIGEADRGELHAMPRTDDLIARAEDRRRKPG